MSELERACDEEIQRELRSVVGCEREIEDRFYKVLTFGTGGLRGVIGAGTNRMNRYTVGRDGMERMERTLAQIRPNPPRVMGGQVLADFSQGLYGLPKSDVLRFGSEDYRMIIRPSGTEPKMKIYLQAKGTTAVDVEKK